MKTSSSLNGACGNGSRIRPTRILAYPPVVQIPGHWSMMRLKHVAAVRPSNVDEKTVEGREPVRLCNYVDVYENDYITEAFDFMQASATPAQIAAFTLKASDVIITKDSETWDDIGCSRLCQDRSSWGSLRLPSCLGTSPARESERRVSLPFFQCRGHLRSVSCCRQRDASVLDSIPPRLAVHCFHCHPLMSNAESLPSSIVKRRRSTP